MKKLYELAVEFQKTGEVPDEVSAYQLAYLLENMQDFFDEYIQEFSNEAITFQEYVVQSMSEWLVDNGFSIEVMQGNFEELMEEAEEEHLTEMLRVGEIKDEEDQSH